jgi:transposase
MPNSFSRIEVITGVGRRRQWTAEQKARIVAESCLPSTTVSAVARRYAINTNQLFQWRRELGANWSRSDVEPEPSFVPLIEDSRPDTGIDIAEHSPISPPSIEVVAGKLSIRVPNGVDEATLRQVLGVVRDFA